MPRIYTVSSENVTVSAPQDLISLKGSSGKICRLRSVWFYMTSTTLQTAQGFRCNVKYGSATVTLGSGGTAPTPRPTDPGDAAASFTCRANDTTIATTSGAFVDITPGGGHNYAGFKWRWFDDFPVFGLNTGIIFSLLSTVSGTCAFSQGAEIEEIG